MEAHQLERHRQKADTQQRIAEAALDLFSEKGFGAVSVEAIGSVACVGHGTVFWHFGSKQTLYIEASRLAGELVRESYVDRLDEFRGVDGLLALLLDMHAFLEANPRVWKMCLSNTCEVSGPSTHLEEAVAYVNREIANVWRRWATEAQAEGVLSADLDPEHVSRIIYATLSGLLVSSLLAGVDVRDYFTSFARMLRFGS